MASKTAKAASDNGGLTITVTDPTRHSEGVNAWIGYTVNTQTTRAEFQSPSSSVLRRYSDFTWLHTKLAHTHPGAIIPPLPDKALVGRFESHFIEARRRALERFLLRVARHADLTQSADLATFLQADEAVLNSVKEEWKRQQMTPPKKALLLFKQAFTQMEQSLSSNPSSVEVPRTDQDTALDNIITYIHILEVQFHTAAREASALMRKEKEVADSFFQLGLAMTLLGQNEPGGLGEVLRVTGHTLDAVSVLEGKKVEEDVINLEDPLTDWNRSVHAAKAAIHRRGEARKVYHEALVEVQQRLHAKNKLVGLIGKEDKLTMAESVLSKAQETAEEKRKSYEGVTDSLLRDLSSFKKEKAEELQRVLVAYTTLQLAHHEKMKSSWNELLPKVTNINVTKDLDSTHTHTLPAAPKAAAAASPEKATKKTKEEGEEENATLIG